MHLNGQKLRTVSPLLPNITNHVCAKQKNALRHWWKYDFTSILSACWVKPSQGPIFYPKPIIYFNDRDSIQRVWFCLFWICKQDIQSAFGVNYRWLVFKYFIYSFYIFRSAFFSLKLLLVIKLKSKEML